jgi:hypothetical protein
LAWELKQVDTIIAKPIVKLLILLLKQLLSEITMKIPEINSDLTGVIPGVD